MRILQLCCISNHWSDIFEVESIDIKTGSDVLDLPDDYGKSFDIIVSAPPCDQFTKANQHNWEPSPDYFIKVAEKCFKISVESGKYWFLENPPGRIEKLITGLKHYRLMTWQGTFSNKEYVIYSNLVILSNKVKRYGKPGTINNYSKTKREEWQKDFVADIERTLLLLR